MKRDSSFMAWIKEGKIYTSVMTLQCTENIRVGFFWQVSTRQKYSSFMNSIPHYSPYDGPEFQLNVEIIGRHKDPNTRTRAIVLICPGNDVRQFCDTLEMVFHTCSNFPFSPFQVMYPLDAHTQNALHKAHKSKTLCLDIVEIAIPEFNDLDTLTPTTKNHQSLCDACFDFSDDHGNNIFIDVDNATRSYDTVLQVRKEDKTVTLAFIQTWIKNQLTILVKRDEATQCNTCTYCLDQIPILANQLSAIAHAPEQRANLKPPPSATAPKPDTKATNHAMVNAWLDLAKVKAVVSVFLSQRSLLEDEATVTTTKLSKILQRTSHQKRRANEEWVTVIE